MTKGIENGLSDVATAVANTAQINKHDTLIINNNYGTLFNQRSTLTQLYIEHGLVQTFIDMPVDDGLRGGFEIIIDEMSDPEDVESIYNYIQKEDLIAKIGQTIKWGRLFGGAGLITVTNQDFNQPFNINKVNEFTELDFIPADCWELNLAYLNQNPIDDRENLAKDYNYYGKRLDSSWVKRFEGKAAPSFKRSQFRGWGMTEVDRVHRSLKQYIKNNNLIFELLDEAKIDVYKITGLNDTLASPQGTAMVEKRLQTANMLKSYLYGLVMDSQDDHMQKQMNFGGLSDILNEIRKGIACDLKMPMTKLFGISSAGFNSGEDDIENYNAMIESEVRAKVRPLIIHVVKLVCKKLLGFVPEEVKIEFPTLRVLSAEQEENVKNQKLNRALSLFQAGAISVETLQEAVNKDDLLPLEVEVTDDIEPPMSFDFSATGTDSEGIKTD